MPTTILREKLNFNPSFLPHQMETWNKSLIMKVNLFQKKDSTKQLDMMKYPRFYYLRFRIMKSLQLTSTLLELRLFLEERDILNPSSEKTKA